MMKIFKKINDQNDPQKRKAWVYTIARNTYLDDQRKRKRWQRLQVWHNPDIEDLSDISDDTAEIPDRIIEERDLNDQLKQIVKKLPSDQREVIVMHYIWELPFREIAEIMNISINTVAARARYGLQKMRIAVGEQK
jgi:RNA polymerase sigma-70 factor (ECF subfamily)